MIMISDNGFSVLVTTFHFGVGGFFAMLAFFVWSLYRPSFDLQFLITLFLSTTYIFPLYGDGQFNF